VFVPAVGYVHLWEDALVEDGGQWRVCVLGTGMEVGEGCRADGARKRHKDRVVLSMRDRAH
jgi:hypothetical protein